MKKYLLLGLAVLIFPAAAYSAVITVMSNQEVASAEDAYFTKNHTYLQVLASSTLPDDETGTVANKLGKNLPPGATVDVYESPKGHGYQVKYVENGTFYSVGYGPEAADRTYSHSMAPVASSTMNIGTSTASTTAQ